MCDVCLGASCPVCEDNTPFFEKGTKVKPRKKFNEFDQDGVRSWTVDGNYGHYFTCAESITELDYDDWENL